MKDELYKYKEYALDVIEGRITTCNYIKLNCRNYLSLFDNPKYVFIPERVDKVVRFFSKFKHSADQHKDKPFELLPFQFHIISYVFGFYYADDTDKRLCRTLVLDIGRKNGKSSLMSMLCLYCTLLENKAESLIIANSYKQGKEIYSILQDFVHTIDNKNKYFKTYRDSLVFGKNKVVVLSGKTSSADGYNPSFGWLEEVHEYTDNSKYNIIKSGGTMRKNFLMCLCTTAGFDKSKWYYGFREELIKNLKSEDRDDSIAFFCYTLDEGDDYKNKGVWIKSNPSIGNIIIEDNIISEVNSTLISPSSTNGVLVKTFNTWTDYITTWLPFELIEQNTQDIHISDFLGKDYILTVGVDLGASYDLTAVGYCFKENVEVRPKYYFFVDFYLPQSCLEGNGLNKEKYIEFKRKGSLKITNTNYTDYDIILQDILNIHNQHPITEISYDAYNSTQFVVNAIKEGLPMKPMSQALWSFNRPTKEFERLLLMGDVVLPKNSCLRWNFENVEIIQDHAGNIKPSKRSQSKSKNNMYKIDGVIALLESLNSTFQQENYDYTPFTLN